MKRGPTLFDLFGAATSDAKPEQRRCRCYRYLPKDADLCNFCAMEAEQKRPAAKAILAEVHAWHGDVTKAEARARLSPQCHAILDLLRERERVSNAELSALALKYTGRISDLRQAGYDVRCVERDRKSGLSWYALAGEGA